MEEDGKIFLCHANEDKPKVREVHQKLIELGYHPWMDEKDLVPGQSFEKEIEVALEKSKCVMIFFSEVSVAKRGFVQKELKHTLRLLDEFPSGEVFIIPVKLDECNVPREFSQLQWVSLNEVDVWEKLAKSLQLVFGDTVAYQHTNFAARMRSAVQQDGDQNIVELIETAEKNVGKTVDELEDPRARQLFLQWHSSAHQFSPDEPLMHEAWRKILEGILEGTVVDGDMMSILQGFEEADAVFLKGLKPGRSFTPEDKKNEARLRKNTFEVLVEEPSSRTFKQMSPLVIPVVVAVVGLVNFFRSMYQMTQDPTKADAFFSSLFWMVGGVIGAFIFAAVLMVLLDIFLPRYRLTWLGNQIRGFL